MWCILASLAAFGADLTHQMSWNLSVAGKVVGHRDVTVKYVKSDVGMRRIVESWTEIDGAAGPVRIRYRQRMTASGEGRDPMSFQSVIDENGRGREVSVRWTPNAWVVTTVADGRSRTGQLEPARVDLSSADLFDPDSRVGLDGRTSARMIQAETGDVLSGTVSDLGHQIVEVGGEPVPVHGWSWDTPQGRQKLWYSSDGFLVRYEAQILGIAVEGLLRRPPPGGVDDFPVALGRPEIEVTPL